MIKDLKKYLLAGAILLLPQIAVFAKTSLNIKGEEATSIGIYITELSTGKVIAENNSKIALTPASVMKAITTASGLSILGPGFRFQTNVYAVGKINGSQLEGNIVIKGAGDPTIDSRHFRDNAGFVDSIVSRLSLMGIKTITGTVIVEQSGIKGQGVNPKWELEDVAWDYGAGYYAFNFYDNYSEVKYPLLASTPAIPGFSVIDNAEIGKNDPVLSRGAGGYSLKISGTVPNKQTFSIPCSMPRPDEVFESELRKTLSANGIEVESRFVEASDTIALYSHFSPLASAIMRSLMVRSDNLMAEGILRAFAPDSAKSFAIERMKTLWDRRGVKSRFTSMYDGSGLTRANSLSPLFIGKVLTWMAKSKLQKQYVALFPKAGVDGTLKGFLGTSRLKGKLALKTGSMSGVQCYAGYKLDENGEPTHAVVIMVNNFYCKRKELIKAVEHLLLQIF